MAIYKELHIASSLFQHPIEVKLNLEDSYIRIGAPIHELVQIRPHFLNPAYVTVSNLYGSPIFNMHTHRHNPNKWTVQENGIEKTIIFRINGTGEVFRLQGTDSGDSVQFEVTGLQLLSRQETQMLAVAVMAVKHHLAMLHLDASQVSAKGLY